MGELLSELIPCGPAAVKLSRPLRSAVPEASVPEDSVPEDSVRTH